MSFVDDSTTTWEVKPHRLGRRRRGYQKVSLSIGSTGGKSVIEVAAGLRDLAELLEAMPDARSQDTSVDVLTLAHDEQDDRLVCIIKRWADPDTPLESLTLPVPKFSLAYEYELSDNA